MRKKSGMWSCLACAWAGSAPLDGRPRLPREKSWSEPPTGLRRTLRDGLCGQETLKPRQGQGLVHSHLASLAKSQVS